RETKASRGILKAIRAKKLSDKVMDDIISGRSGGTAVGSFDDRRLLKKLDEVKNAQPDIIERAGMIYEVRRKGDNYRQIVRSKSMIRWKFASHFPGRAHLFHPPRHGMT